MKIYIYSNSTRHRNKNLNTSYVPDPDAMHMFLNDAHPLYTNLDLFKNIQHKAILFAFDSWSYIYNLKQMFIHDVTFEHIITTSTAQYCIVDPTTYCYVSTSGKINNKINDATINLTTGARAVLVCLQMFNNPEITLVNFFDDTDPTYNVCKTHDMNVEKNLITKYKNVKLMYI